MSLVSQSLQVVARRKPLYVCNAPEPLEGNALELEGHKLVAVNTGRRNAVLQYAARLSGVVEKTFVRGNLVFGRSTAAQPARIGRVMQRGEEI